MGGNAACAACPSPQAPLGATLSSGGATFRVWAPFAQSVSVAGTFNRWNAAANPLCPEGNGCWSGEAAGVTNGAEYKYVIVNNGQTLWRQDPVGARVVTSTGNSVVYDQGRFAWTDEQATLAGAEKLVIYELHIGTFNDPNRADKIVGTFDTAAQRIPYLADLGVNMVKVMPVGEFAGDYSWGYNPSLPYAVEGAYGGPDAFKRFVDACHARHIGVTLDVVYNHLGPTDLSLWQFDGWSQNGKGGIYFYQDGRGDTPWGPRPDYGRPEVSAYIAQNALYWLTDYHLDGLRWDATAFIRNVYGNNNDPANDIAAGWALLQSANAMIDTVQPWVISVAEDLRGNPWMTKPTGAGGAGFDSQWDGAFVDLVRPALETGSDAARDMNGVRDAIARKYNSNVHERVLYTESHDAVANGSQRVPSTIDPTNPGSYWARKRSTLGAALVLSSPGIPMIFQGQEFLEDGWFSDQDPVDWSKTNTYARVRLLYKDLIALRTNRGNTTRGLTGQSLNIHHVNNTDKVIAFHRWQNGGAGDDVIVIANFANKKWQTGQNYRMGFPRAGRWNVRFNSDKRIYSSDFGDFGPAYVNTQNTPWNGMAYSAVVSLPPYSVLILSQ
ncbi:MAG: alpha amylase C-terminal domain-containing protein [Lentisphaerae bacterium]|nr:alpha amylase C-terminal domain-containing protein [Lentisphaerota bacterium]